MMAEERKKFYITTAIPYVNAQPHLGHALEFTQADVLARYHRIRGGEALLLSGSDDNALKNVKAAEAAGVDARTFTAANAELFVKLAKKLHIELDMFQRGSDTTHHFSSSQKLWRLCDAAGDIYKQAYQGLYCVGCETFYTPDELNETGECFEHPGRLLDRVSEENYFFRLSKYQPQLIELVESGELRITPDSRKNEMLSFLKLPLQDISISRSNERARNWGVPVPGDETQRIYVWFDGLNIYQSGVGFGWDEVLYKKWWPADVHLIGKGITRFHAVYWPAFLLSAKLLLPRAIFVHGYITVEGQKMSKTVGNVIDPFALIEKYGADAVRYYLLREIPSGEDGDFSYEKFEARYNGDLANGLGNLVARVAKLGEKISPIIFKEEDKNTILRGAVDFVARDAYAGAIVGFYLHEALGNIWTLIGVADKYINEQKPWVARSDDAALGRVIGNAAMVIDSIAKLVAPFLPETAAKIHEQISFKDEVIEIKKSGSLFPRLP